MCVGDVSNTQRDWAFARRWRWQRRAISQNETTGVRDGIIEEDAAGEVSLIDATLIMVRPMSPAVRGCAEHARRSR
jgi:hypothetical protein